MATSDLSVFSRDGVTPPRNAVLVVDEDGNTAALEVPDTDGAVLMVKAGRPAMGALFVIVHEPPEGFVAPLVLDDTPVTGGSYAWDGDEYIQLAAWSPS
jgi:hypothetical protein